MEYRTLDVDGYMNNSSMFRPPQQDEPKETVLKSRLNDQDDSSTSLKNSH